MMRWIGIGVVCLAATGCGVTMAPLGSDETPPSRPIVAAPGDEGPHTGGDITLRWYDARPSPESERRPSFEIESREFTQLPDETWTFQNAQAVIYGREGEDVHLNADWAWMNYESQQAVLEGNVRLRRGTLVIEMEKMEWSEEERKAVSDLPVVVRDGATYLEASGVTYYPDENRSRMTDAAGRISSAGRPSE